MAVVDSSLVTDAIIDLLEAQMPVPIGDGMAPSVIGEGAVEAALTAGYVVVYRVPSGSRYSGSWIGGQESSMDTIQYQITAAGVTRRQVERLSEAAIDVICARGDAVNDRDFIHGMPVAGHKVLDRKRSGTVPTDALGSMQAGGNVDIFVTVI